MNGFSGKQGNLSPRSLPRNGVSDTESAQRALTILHSTGALPGRSLSPVGSIQSQYSPVPRESSISYSPLPQSISLDSARNTTPIRELPVSLYPTQQNGISSVYSGSVPGNQIVESKEGSTVVIPPLTPRASLSSPFNSSKRILTVFPEVKESDIDEFLKKRGYSQTGTITTDVGQGETVLYIKANDPMGNRVLITPNLQGQVSVELGDRTVVKVSEGFDVPQVTRMTLEQCAKSPGCGAAYQCDDKFCVLNSDNDGGYRESTYIVTSGPVNQTLTEAGRSLAVPIITLSQIQNNEEETIAYTTKTFDAIKVNAENALLEELEVIIQKSISLNNDLMNLKGYITSVLNERRSEENVARRIMVDHYKLLKGGKVLETNEAKVKTLVDKMNDLNTVEERLLSRLSDYNHMAREHLDVLSDRTMDAKTSLYLETYNLDDQMSAGLRVPEKWGLPSAIAGQGPDEVRSGAWVVKVDETPLTQSLYRSAQTFV